MTLGRMRRAVFLDRDGVLNRAVLRAGVSSPPARAEDVVVLPGVVDACHRLSHAGWYLIVVTNQPDVARGTTTRDTVDAINQVVTRDLPVTEVVVCPHDDADECDCRKPAPGMLRAAAARWNIDLPASVMIGDRWRDIEAGRRAGVRTILVAPDCAHTEPCTPDAVVTDLAAAVDVILGGVRRAEAVDPPSVDDWEHHWSRYADVASDNPAQAYRRSLIIEAVERQGIPARLLDIGSGQGDLLASLRSRWPSTALAGVELSAEGVKVASAKVPGAQLFQVDLLQAPAVPDPLLAWADVGVCSEVLEHVEDPARLLRAGATGVAHGGRIMITVPGGPRTAFDRSIGHRQHFRPSSLEPIIREAGLTVEWVRGAGFPFFTIYKSLLYLRGNALIDDLAAREQPSRLASVLMQGFSTVLRPSLNSSRHGWQVIALARRP